MLNPAQHLPDMLEVEKFYISMLEQELAHPIHPSSCRSQRSGAERGGSDVALAIAAGPGGHSAYGA
jgi:hypothetical protein